MADTDNTRKGSTAWVWLVALVAVIVGVWYWTERASGPIHDYVEFSGARNGGADVPAMDTDHEYVAEGLRKLSGALEELVDDTGNAEARDKLDRLQGIAERLQADPASHEHANSVRQAFTVATDIIAAVEGAPAAQELRSIAASIDEGQPLLEQREKVRRFFREAGEIVDAAAG